MMRIGPKGGALQTNTPQGGQVEHLTQQTTPPLGEFGFPFPLSALFDLHIHACVGHRLVRASKAIHFSKVSARSTATVFGPHSALCCKPRVPGSVLTNCSSSSSSRLRLAWVCSSWSQRMRKLLARPLKTRPLLQTPEPASLISRRWGGQNESQKLLAEPDTPPPLPPAPSPGRGDRRFRTASAVGRQGSAKTCMNGGEEHHDQGLDLVLITSHLLAQLRMQA